MNPTVPADALGVAPGQMAPDDEPRPVALDHLVTHEEWLHDWSLREERFEVVDVERMRACGIVTHSSAEERIPLTLIFC